MDAIKIGCLMKTYANYIADSRNDFSYLSYYLTNDEYHNLLCYINLRNRAPRKTMFNYLRYVLFKETRINETLKRHICNKLSKIVADNYTGTAFPENKIDPIVAPLSNKEKICVDCILLKKTKSLELPYPSIKIRIKEYIKEYI